MATAEAGRPAVTPRTRSRSGVALLVQSLPDSFAWTAPWQPWLWRQKLAGTIDGTILLYHVGPRHRS